MTILVNRLIIDNDIVELIRLFMSEASGKINLKNGLSKNLNPETYDKAVGLVEVMVPFETYITAVQPNESKIWKKREFFCFSYQNFFITFKDSCKDNLSEIIEVIYRVRSNMIHGNKTLNSERNKILIINSFHLIYNILDHILREEEIIR